MGEPEDGTVGYPAVPEAGGPDPAGDLSEPLRVAVLGAMLVYRDGREVSAGPPQQQAMLAYLLLQSGHTVSARQIVDAVWEFPPAGGGIRTLRTYAWRLRRLLEPDPSQPRVLVSHGDGYRFLVPPDALDVQRAETLIRRAATARGEGLLRQACALLTEALGLWRGEPLAGVPGPFAEMQRDRLGELRLVALEEQLDLQLRLDGEMFATSALTELTAAYPLRERPHGLLMRALQLAGRQADALAVYARFRRRIVDELGVEPGPELAAVHAAILAGGTGHGEREANGGEPAEDTETGDAAASEDAPATAPPERSVRAPLPVPRQLPPTLPDFVGRTAGLYRLLALLTETGRDTPAVVAVAGMGGIGKTSLALCAAHRVRSAYPDGQLHADLGGEGENPAGPSTVLAGFLTSLGIAPEAVPERLEDRRALLRSLLDGRRVLLVLDNVRDAAQVRDMIPSSPECGVILTTRAVPVGLPLTAHLALDAFAPEEALDLLVAVIGAERVAAEPAQARRLVQACGLLPLAVRIVANRLSARPGWTIRALADRVDNERRRLSELRVGDLAIGAVFELSYQQLSLAQALAFRLLSVPGAATVSLGSAAALLGAPEATAELLLESLVDAALLESPEPGRYHYHALVRAYAAQRAAERPDEEADVALRALLEHLLATSCAALAHVVPGDPVANLVGPLPMPGLTFPDIHAARTWANEEFEIVTAVARRAAASPSTRDPGRLRVAADLLLCTSPLSHDTRYPRLADTADLVREAAQRCGDEPSAARALLILAIAALRASRPAEAARHARAAVEISRRTGERDILRQALNDLGVACQYLRRFEEALACYDESVALARELGHRSAEAATTLNAGLARVRSGRAAEAVPSCESALALTDSLGDRPGKASGHYVLGLALHELGRYDEAVAHFTACLVTSRASSLPDRASQSLYRLAETLRVMGRYDEAEKYAAESVENCEELGIERDLAHALTVLGRTLGQRGETDAALAHLRRAHTLFVRLGLPDADDVLALLNEADDRLVG
ncbi:tetratricopeptide repeat protein [Amycolatopsis sp. NBC_00345]|uniref:AfsR/SARP family transcriptional regulator n=1 Tax=Amycolatopsis sp. NBC_00345 TaxID=2975955 RepID=UPI002E25854E